MKCERCYALGQFLQNILWSGTEAWLCPQCFNDVRCENIAMSSRPLPYVVTTDAK